MTSLAEQLKRLAIPQTTALVDSKKRASLLFDPKEAAAISRDAIFDIGLSGLNELIVLDPNFQYFQNNLFNENSKKMQRAVLSHEVNQKLDKQIQKFFIRLSPFLLLKPAHKALEWLICRFRIHESNVNDLLILILPYHETNIFTRIIQMIHLKAQQNRSWVWLEHFSNQGTHLNRTVLINQIASDSGFLRIICDALLNHLKVHRKTNTENKLRALFGLYATSLIGVLHRDPVTDNILTVILPSLIAGLKDNFVDFQASSLMICGELFANNQLSEKVNQNLFEIILFWNNRILERERAYLILIMFQTQQSPPTFGTDIIHSILKLVPIWKELSGSDVFVGPLVFKLTEFMFNEIWSCGEINAEYQAGLWQVLDEIKLDLFFAKKIVRYLSGHVENTEVKDKQKNEDVYQWVKALLEHVCLKYVELFNSDKDAVEFQNIYRKWCTHSGVEIDPIMASLISKCTGPNKSKIWEQLKPLLIEKVENPQIFKILCKMAPSTDYLVLFFWIDRCIHSDVSENSKKMRKLYFDKLVKYNFGQNPHFIAILSLLKANPDASIEETIENYFLNDDYDFDVELWWKAIVDARKSQKIVDENRIWLLSLKMLIKNFWLKWKAEHHELILTAIYSIKTMKYGQQVDILMYLCNKFATVSKTPCNWWDLDNDITIWIRIKMFECILIGLYKRSSFYEEYGSLILNFFDKCMADFLDGIRFLCGICAGCPNFDDSKSLYTISPELQILALYRAFFQLSAIDEKAVVHIFPEYHVMVCYILMTLSSTYTAVRKAGIQVLRIFNKLLNFKTDLTLPFATLFDYILKRSDEIILNAEQINVVLFYLLSPDESVQAVLDENVSKNLIIARNILLKVIVDEKVPLYVATRISQLLENVNSVEIMTILSRSCEKAVKCGSNEIQEKMLTSYWHRLYTTTAPALSEPEVWNLAENCLKHDKCGLYFLKNITKELWAVLPEKRQSLLLELLITSRAETGNDAVSSAIAHVVRKITLNAEITLSLLKNMMLNLSKDISNPNAILKSLEWRKGVALLELIQSKKKLKNSSNLLEPLFAILKFCLDQDEQTIFEYTKQLVLGCLLDVCDRFRNESKLTDTCSRLLNVELIVQCLRASSNPQTHHHALLLLSCLGSLIPNEVMHNIMAIFTFMGSSVTRLDDEHSVQVVTKVVDTIVPVLLKNLKAGNVLEYTVIAQVLRIFVWTLKDIPQHRRKPLFSRLLIALSPESALGIFLLLLFENYIVHGHKEEKPKDSLSGSLLLGLELCLSFGCWTTLNTVLYLIKYLVNIPIEKMNPESTRDLKKSKNDGLFDVEKYSPKELRHFTYTLITFLNTLLSDNNLIIQVSNLENSEKNEKDNIELQHIFKVSIAKLLKFVPQCSTQFESQQTKFWKAMVQHGYDLIDRLVSLISCETLVGVVNGLITSSTPFLRRKGIELLNVHIQSRRSAYNDVEKAALRQLVDPLTNLACSDDDNKNNYELIQQAAFLALRLLGKCLSSDNLQLFKQVLISSTRLITSKTCTNLVFASAVLTIADLSTQLKVHAISELPNFLPVILKEFLKYKKSSLESPDLLLLSIVAALARLIDVLSQFLSPYIDKLLFATCVLSSKWPDAIDLHKRLSLIRHKIANTIAPRVLIPSINRCYSQLVLKKQFPAIGPLLSLLSESFSQISDVSKLLNDLTPFFITTLQFRSDATPDTQEEVINVVEENAIDAILPFVLKLSELSFKPLYYQIYHWSSENRLRSITFYKLSYRLAERLKGLFVLFAGHFVHNAATLLDATNINKTPDGYFDDVSRSCMLLENILRTLHTVFLFNSTDSANFLNKDKFQLLVTPLIDQLENTLGGSDALKLRTEELLTPCISQMALSIDDTQWKMLNYQLLVKTRSASAQVRIGALDTIVELAVKLGEDYLTLLPETIGSLAELLEDEDEKVEEAMKNALRRMEEVLGQPIRDFFQ